MKLFKTPAAAAGLFLILAGFAGLCSAGAPRLLRDPHAVKNAVGPHAGTPSAVPPAAPERQAERVEMVRIIRGYGLKDPGVLAAMAEVPRHLFVPAGYQDRAYDDRPLPIGFGQTISQPFIVAEMTRLLRLEKRSRVLEIGTGSGYQAAVLTRFTPHVYSVEIIQTLAEEAQQRLNRWGYAVATRRGDGYFGWPEKAPYDGIVVTAAAGEIPPPLVRQLAPGGRMVIPVGPVFGTQSLMLLQKDADGRVQTRSLMPVRFVPLTRQDRSRH